MPYTKNFLHYEDIHFSEEEKNEFNYIQKKMDYYIYHLVHDKDRIQKCRNLYHGRRDAQEFQYLENTFGIEQPIGLKMTPIIKTRIDTLIGIFLDENRRFLVSVNDSGTHDKINNEKKNLRIKRIKERFNASLINDIDAVNKGLAPNTQNPVDKEFLDKLEKSITEDFISEFEIAAQSLIKFFEQSNEVGLRQKLKLMLLDFLVTGETYYRIHNEYLGDDPTVEVCKPENTFFNKNTNEQFLKTDAVVHRTFMKRSELVAKWGHLMNEEIKKELYGTRPGLTSQHYVDTGYEVEMQRRNLFNNKGVYQQYTYDNNDIVTVYEVEWIASTEVELTDQEMKFLEKTEKIKFNSEHNIGVSKVGAEVRRKGVRQDRFYGIRIGEYIYLGCGKAKHQIRSQSNPLKTKLTFNGVGYNERTNGEAYSLAWALKDIQDLYDITMFHRDNFIANSGVNGTRVNLAGIPKILGETFMDRVQKFIAYRKQGIELIDPTEPGAQLFQHYGDFKAAIDGNAIQALQTVLESLEQQADIVSGVNRFMYRAAEERDAVSNVNTGIRQTSLIVKDPFVLMNDNMLHLYTDLINAAKITYKYGKKGSYIVEGKTYLFEVLPEQFSFTDYNINIVDSQKELVKIDRITNTVNEMIKAGIMDPKLAILINTTDSTTEIISMVRESLAKTEEKNNQVSQLSQQLQEMDGMLKQYQQQVSQYENQIKALEKKSIDLEHAKFEWEKEKFGIEHQLEETKETREQQLAESEMKKDEAVVELEREQLYMSTNAGKEIKNDL